LQRKGKQGDRRHPHGKYARNLRTASSSLGKATV
jgi:hypothetical protein